MTTYIEETTTTQAPARQEPAGAADAAGTADIARGIGVSARALARLAEMTAYSAIERRRDSASARAWLSMSAATAFSALSTLFLALAIRGCAQPARAWLIVVLDTACFACSFAAWAWMSRLFFKNNRDAAYYQAQLDGFRWAVPASGEAREAYCAFYSRPARKE